MGLYPPACLGLWGWTSCGDGAEGTGITGIGMWGLVSWGWGGCGGGYMRMGLWG